MQNIVIDNLLVMAIIKAVGNILTAAVPSTVTYLIGRKLINQRKLQEKLNLALSDIQYLLLLEKLHCREHQIDVGQSKKQLMRDCVKHETNLSLSGRFTFSRINRELSSQTRSQINSKPIRPSRQYSAF
ncbi:hypothetical protein [Shewanella algicola]|uniref:hypothetical protein n=1 Tax=Shewanella algicola TaxID=640633 RepID=UPI0024944319|nr:hypothetical protein [Shewanella algicola]